MISAECPQCRFSREVRDALKGREAACPKCRTAFIIGEKVETPIVAEPPPVQTRSPEIKKPIESRPNKAPPASPKTPVPPPVPTTSIAAPVAVPVETRPTSQPAPEKIPNPFAKGKGTLGICPTLQTQEEFDRYRAMLLPPLQTPLKTTPMSAGYKLGLFLLALFLVLLPLTYVAIVLGLCAFEYFYFAWTFDSFSEAMTKTPGKGAVLGAILYFALPTGLGAVILVLLKPLIFGWGGKDTRFEITKDREPLLFDFVQQLCRFVGAPMPRRIFVSCDVNAAAGLSHGFRSALFGGNDCDLYVGLPLVAGMNTTAFAGVLAHEFGHFTQSGARRISYVVRTILGWFAHIYYYRDRMDAWLEQGCNAGVVYFSIFFWVIRFVVWLARRVIWVLMTLGHFAAGFMSRQMEYDADSFEIRLGGSERFARSTKRLLMLNIANDRTVGDLNYMLQEDRLADNYPLLIAANMEMLEDRLQKPADKIIRDGKTGWGDTHPCDRDRIGAAERMAEPGVLHVDLPASLLFRNFLALSREVSLHFYRNDVGLKLEPTMLKNAGAVVEQLRRENLGLEAIVAFFQRAYANGRFLPLQRVEPSKDARNMAFRLRQARDNQAGFAVDCLDAVKSFGKAEEKFIRATAFQELVRIGAKVDMSQAGFSFRNMGEAVRVTDRLNAELLGQAARLGNRDIWAAERFSCARELLGRPEMQARIENAETLHRRMETLFPILVKIGETQDELDGARHRLVAASVWIERISSIGADKAQSLFRTLEEEADLFKRLTKRYQMAFSGMAYPFEHGNKETTLGAFLVPKWSEAEMGPFDFYQAFGTLLGRLQTTYQLALGECLVIALAVEQAMGLTPLPVPPEEDEEETT